MEKNPQAVTELLPFVDAESSETKRKSLKRCTVVSLTVCILLSVSLLLCFVFTHFWKPTPEKIYDVEYNVLSPDEKTTKVLVEIDPRNKAETFWTANGTDEVVEIHDFKTGITGIFMVGIQKCFIKTQTKDIPDVPTTEIEQLEEEEEEITETYQEESMVWVPAEKAIEDKEFLRNSKIFEICKNVPVHWIHPVFPSAPEFMDFGEDAGEVGLMAANENNDLQKPSDVRAKPGNKRPARSLTEEDLPVNDYREVGLEFDPMYDHRGYCCTHCRRGQRYCRRVCEPLLGFYPYPYCYGGGRVICRIIMPCNWWVARMLGRV